MKRQFLMLGHVLVILAMLVLPSSSVSLAQTGGGQGQGTISMGPSLAGEVAYLQNGDIWLLNLGSGQQNKVTNDGKIGSLTWTRDGTSIVFASTSDGASRIYRMHPDGSALDRITNGTGEDFSPSYSSDGSLYFGRDQQGSNGPTLHQVIRQAPGGAETVVFSEATDICNMNRVSASSNGTVAITYWCGRGKSVQLVSGGGGATSPAPQVGNSCLYNGIWAHTRSWLAVSEEPNCENSDSSTWPVHIFDYTGSSPTQRSLGTFGSGELSDWSPDDHYLVFAGSPMFIVDTQSRAKQSLSVGGTAPAWRPEAAQPLPTAPPTPTTSPPVPQPPPAPQPPPPSPPTVGKWSGDCTTAYAHACLPLTLTIDGLSSQWQTEIRAAADLWNTAGSKFRFNIGTVAESTRLVHLGAPGLEHIQVAPGEVRVIPTSKVQGYDMGDNAGLALLLYQPGTKNLIGVLIIVQDGRLPAGVFWGFDGVPADKKLDFRTVMAHELGHAAGLGHINGNPKPVMYSFEDDFIRTALSGFPGFTQRSLTFTDRDALLQLYGPSSTSTRTFPETGKTLTGRFYETWQSGRSFDDSLYINGLPISDAHNEASLTDGKTYLTQWFERARLEYHPENQPPYDVLLGLLGSAAVKGRENEPPFKPVPNPAAIFHVLTLPKSPAFALPWFRETGHTLGDSSEGGQAIAAYWNNLGGLSQFGFPLSQPFMERNQGDGKSYLVQYFERQRFEYHPENKGTRYEVLLGRLGAEQEGRPSQPQPVAEQTVQVQAASDWENSGVSVAAGQTLTIQYVSGYWRPWPGPNYDGRGYINGPPPAPTDESVLPSVTHAALIARIGDGPPFYVGNGVTMPVGRAGKVLMRINDTRLSDNSGALTVRVRVDP